MPHLLEKHPIWPNRGPPSPSQLFGQPPISSVRNALRPAEKLKRDSTTTSSSALCRSAPCLSPCIFCLFARKLLVKVIQPTTPPSTRTKVIWKMIPTLSPRRVPSPRCSGSGSSGCSSLSSRASAMAPTIFPSYSGWLIYFTTSGSRSM